MTIKEYDYKPEPKEHAEAGKEPEPKDCTITNELEQCKLLDFISDNAKCTRIAVSDLENGLASFDGIPLAVIQNQVDILTQLVRTMDAVYSQLNQSYQDAAKEAYKTFCIDNLLLINMLKRRLNEGMRGE